jgi:parvulin-like peptidyl-prolyl isomerase
MNRQYLLRAANGLALAAALLVASAVAADLPAGTVALVNGKPVSAAALDDAVRQSGQADSPALRNAQKGMLIARAVLAQQAESEGYAARPDAARALQQAHEATLVALYMRDKVRPAAVSDEQVRARYDRIVGSLGSREYKARIIRLADDASAQDVLRQLKAGAAFDALASRHSTAPSRESGGAMNWVSFPEPVSEGHTQGLPLPVAAAIASLPPGTVSAAPIAAGDARYLVKVEQVRPVTTPPYEEAAPGVRRALEAQEMQRAITALLVDLMRKASISQ